MEINNVKRDRKRTYLFSALIALFVSVLVVGANNYFKDERVTINHLTKPAEHRVLYTADSEGNIEPLDFTVTSKKVLDAVVNVTATRKANSDMQQFDYRKLPDPFREFFRNHPFGGEGGDEENRLMPHPMVGTGSGVIISEKGYVITNNHVIDQAEEVEVTLHTNETKKARVIGTDPNTDLALLQIEGDELKALPLVNSDDVEVGEWVLAVGNPFGLSSTVTAGIVSAKARNININKEKFAVESFIQTDAAINPGNSGGALVNLDGGLIGINTAIASRTGTYNGYGFAVPSNIVAKVVEDLLQYGTVQRGVLGVSIQTIDGALARERGIPFREGVYVAGVAENSAAEAAGLKEGDIILKVDDRPTGTSPALQEIIARHRPGDKLNLTYFRDGVEKQVEVTLKNMEGTTSLIKKENRAIRDFLGAEFEDLDMETARELAIEGGVRVTVLYPGKLRRETQMREGFIITHVDGKAVKNTTSLMKTLEGSSGGVMLEGRYEGQEKTYYYAIGLE